VKNKLLATGFILWKQCHHRGFNRSVRSAVKTARRGVMQILFPKLKLGANYFMTPSRRGESPFCELANK